MSNQQKAESVNVYALNRIKELTDELQSINVQIHQLTEAALRVQGAIAAFQEMSKINGGGV
jgi:prefoldin subunit 5